MNKKSVLILGALLSFGALEAAYTIKDGKIISAESAPKTSLREHFELAQQAFQECNYRDAALNFRIVAKNAPMSSLGQESNYWLGVCYYNMEDFDFANEAFSDYLKGGSNPAFFEQAVEYKYMIAEQFRQGAKRYPFGTKQLPKWASGIDMAPQIYDEVIAAMPSGDMAARAFYAKGWLLSELKEYRNSIEALQMLIKRFPKHELAPDAYLMITCVYREQCQFEFQNPDLLALAEMALRKFENDFPREERLEIARVNVLCIKELYAKGLYEIGQFYERTKQPHASIIYYQNAISQFPDTQVAARCRGRLTQLRPELVSESVQTDSSQGIKS